MTIITNINEDYHLHSSTFSDGIPTINEIVQYAGVLGRKKIAITDHSDKVLKFQGICGAKRYSLKDWANVYNDVEVEFGVEGDLLDGGGNVCMEMQGKQPNFIILSAHAEIYGVNKKNITDGYLKAIAEHGSKIKFLGHPTFNRTAEHLDIETLVKACNDAHIGLELNSKYFFSGRLDLNKTKKMLELADKIYVNSDAHTLAGMRDFTKQAYGWLRKEGFLGLQF
jgi:histidinol phosphatase-like PHP family hydrolase